MAHTSWHKPQGKLFVSNLVGSWWRSLHHRFRHNRLVVDKPPASCPTLCSPEMGACYSKFVNKISFLPLSHTIDSPHRNHRGAGSSRYGGSRTWLFAVWAFFGPWRGEAWRDCRGCGIPTAEPLTIPTTSPSPSPIFLKTSLLKSRQSQSAAGESTHSHSGAVLHNAPRSRRRETGLLP